MNKKLIGALAPLVLVAACSGTSSASKTVTATVTKTVSGSADSGRSGQGDGTSDNAPGTFAYGKSATSGGITITLGPLAPFTPSDSASADSPFAKKEYRKMTVTLVNRSGKSMHSSDLVLQGMAGDKSVYEVGDSGQRVGNPIMVTVLNGRTLTWTAAFPVETGKPLTISVRDMSSGFVGTWDSTVK